MCIEPFGCSATQMLNGSCILGGVVGDSLTMSAVDRGAVYKVASTRMR